MRNENWEEKVNGFASFEAKKFSPSFRLEAKITKSKRREKFKAKKSEKMDFVSLCFASKRKLLKWSENKRKEAKISEKIEVKFYGEQAKHMWNGSNFALFRL